MHLQACSSDLTPSALYYTHCCAVCRFPGAGSLPSFATSPFQLGFPEALGGDGGESEDGVEAEAQQVGGQEAGARSACSDAPLLVHPVGWPTFVWTHAGFSMLPSKRRSATMNGRRELTN